MPKEDWIKNTVQGIFTEAKLWPWKPGELTSVLDVACGLSLKSQYLDIPVRVGVDIYDEYLKRIDTKVPYAVVKYDVRRLDEIFPEKSFDIVLALDIVEHLEKDESLKMIEVLERIARKAVIIETPKGFVPQNIDIWGHGGDEFQTHRCGWEKSELEARGYNVVLRDYVMSDAKRHTDLDVPREVQLIDAIKFIA